LGGCQTSFSYSFLKFVEEKFTNYLLSTQKFRPSSAKMCSDTPCYKANTTSYPNIVERKHRPSHLKLWGKSPSSLKVFSQEELLLRPTLNLNEWLMNDLVLGFNTHSVVGLLYPLHMCFLFRKKVQERICGSGTHYHIRTA